MQKFAEKLASRYHERRLQQKVWEAWHSVIENKWRSRVEKACQAKAQEVCLQLTNDYEAKVAAVSKIQTIRFKAKGAGEVLPFLDYLTSSKATPI